MATASTTSMVQGQPLSRAVIRVGSTDSRHGPRHSGLKLAGQNDPRCRIWACGGVRPTQRRYTLAKFLALDEYQRTVPWWRAVGVILFTPAPMLAAVLLVTAIPLEDPRAGALANRGFFLHLFATSWTITIGSNLVLHSDAGLSRADYTWWEMVLSATTTSVLLTLLAFGITVAWRFPMPFLADTLAIPWLVLLLTGNAVVLGRQRLWGSTRVRNAILAVLPAFLLQVLQVVIYPAFGAAFEFANDRERILLILVFPFLRLLIRQITRYLAPQHRLGDTSEVAAIAGTEISAILYQAAIMQLTPSRLTTIVVLVVEMLQGLEAVVVFYRMGSQTNVSAVAYALRCVRPTTDASLTSLSMINEEHLMDVEATMKVPATLAAVLPHAQVERVRRHEIDKRIVLHALQILCAAETLMLTEYIEVMIPMVNLTFLCVASQVDSARYTTPSSRPFTMTPRVCLRCSGASRSTRSCKG